MQKKKIPFRKFKPNKGENMIDLFIRSQEFIDKLIRQFVDKNFFHKKYEEFKYTYQKTKFINELNIKYKIFKKIEIILVQI